MARLQFQQVDVFSSSAFGGNPLAVVAGADALTDAQMQRIANWTNLSETTFLCRPSRGDADYRVRIFTPERELPFAGHPTLGTCHVWLSLENTPKRAEVVQECGVGLVRIRRDVGRLAFAAPPLRRSGALEPQLLNGICKALALDAAAIKASQWLDNGPGWAGVMLATRADLLAVKRDYAVLPGQPIGLVAPCDPVLDDTDPQFEVRAFVGTRPAEDPVTGSLNAALAQWLIGAGLAPETYIAAQGTVLGRTGRVHVARSGADIWIGGHVKTCIEGTIEI
jgi:PhzF family phenazine biosynthesis protein